MMITVKHNLGCDLHVSASVTCGTLWETPDGYGSGEGGGGENVSL